MNDSLIVRVWNNYYRKEESVIGQRFLEGIFFNKVNQNSPIEDIVKAGKRASYILGKATIPMKVSHTFKEEKQQIFDKLIKLSCRL